MTTGNVARDLDRVRSALGERRISFLDISWGTWLGAVYRSEFPDRVERMFLDSVASPEFTLAAFDDGRADAAESRFARPAAWIASHDEAYGLGTSAAEVRAAVLGPIGAYDANPVRYTDLGRPVDGAVVASRIDRGCAGLPVAP
ncbi:alpha/beta fold hydrolase [Streptomyces hoynatensis]|uniref:Alpha/beta fold hydrolase n=1 Tax=Streptomyces hoynatensis TaxID=1141874 RepID=A0A3A9YMT8_9ACTN|nr:alpha/beta fold hydrolase [Streptomyces hoynatensis]